MRSVGVIGGLGPGATSWLYLELMKGCIERDAPTYPWIQIYSVPLARRLESPFLTGTAGLGEERTVVDLVAGGVRALSDQGVGLVLMPCNTLHLYLDEITHVAGEGAAPVADMRRLAWAKLPPDSRTLVLGTGTTRASGVYEVHSSETKELFYPSVEEQHVVETLIHRCIEDPSFDPWPILNSLVDRQGRDHDSVLVACTDLCVTGSPRRDRTVVSSLQVLAECGIDFILERRGADEPWSNGCAPVAQQGEVHAG